MKYKSILFITTLLRNSKKHLLSFGSLLMLFVIMQLFNFATTGSPYEVEHKGYYNSHFQNTRLNLPDDFNFSYEKVPLNNFSVVEGLEKEFLSNPYSQSQMLLLQKQTNRWFPVIEPILKRYNIPDDFKYIVVVESGLTNCTSSAKAVGYWQIIESTGINYGLEINTNVDERYDMEKSTEAACKYFKEAYKKFKNWTLVAASYNMGIGGISMQLDKQKVGNYYDLYLNGETARYVFRILSIKELLSRPDAYGFVLLKPSRHIAPPIKKLTVDSSITDLVDFALKQGTNYKSLKLLNPWLLSSSLSNSEGKIYTLQLPQKGVNIFDWTDFYEQTTICSDMDSLKHFSNPALIVDSTQTIASNKNEY